MGEELAGAADAGLHLVEHQQQAVLVAELAQAPSGIGGGTGARRPRPARLDEDAAVSSPIAFFTALKSPKGTWSKPIARAEAFEILLVAGRRRSSPACGRGRRLRR
jgi:hypothetical protein